MGFFANSQKIRFEIENSDFLTRIEYAFYIDGLVNNVYGARVQRHYIGKLSSGLHVSMISSFRNLEGNLEEQMKEMEIYCQNIEELADNGERTLDFLVSVTCGEKVGLLVKDLSNGGKMSVFGKFGEPYVKVNGNSKPIYVGVNSGSNDNHYFHLRYFHESNRIQL